MNVAAKITLLTNPNRVSVGENLYKLLHPTIQIEFHELVYGTDEWITLIVTLTIFTNSTHRIKN